MDGLRPTIFHVEIWNHHPIDSQPFNPIDGHQRFQDAMGKSTQKPAMEIRGNRRV